MKKLLLLLLSGICYGEPAILNTFTSGELSAHLDARVDFEKYSSGCKTLENFYVLPYGGAKKRSGTQYIADAKTKAVLKPFSVGVDQSYVLEIGDQYIRFYRDGIQITDTSGVPIEVSTPYSSNDVFEIQFAQFGDIMYMAHPDYPVQKLIRTSTTPSFSIEDVSFIWPPVLDGNTSDVTLTPSAITGSVTVTASDDLFTTNHVNSQWVIRSPYDNNSVQLSLSANGTSDELRVEGDWNLRTIGNAFEGILELQYSEDGGETWGTYRQYENGSSNKRNYDRSGEETVFGTRYRMVFTGSGGGTAYLKCESPYLNGFVTITNFLSATQVQAVVEVELGSTEATDIWYEGAFSKERGYPRTIEFFENRLWFGGTDYSVNTLWASMTDAYESFQTGDYDDNSLRLSINSDNVIVWLLARSQLFIGTLGDEWLLSGGDSSTPISPVSVLARRQTGYGSRDGIDALVASDSVIYLQRQGRKIREFEYSLESDSYKSIDTTLLAQHITKGGVVQIDEQQQPEPVIWCVKGNGELVGLTFNKIQNVYGWHRHVTNGDFESVAVIPTLGEDRVYVIVNRKNGRYIEWFRPVDWGDDEDAWFVDSGLDYDGGDPIPIDDIILGTQEVSLVANNSVSDGQTLRLSGQGGLSFAGFVDGIFIATNCTSTNLTLLYKDGTDIVVSGTYTGGVTATEVQQTFTTVEHLAGQKLKVFADSGVQPDVTVSTNGTITLSDYHNRVIVGLPYTATLSPMYIDILNQNMNSFANYKTIMRAHFRVNDAGAFNYGTDLDEMYPVSVKTPEITAGSPVPFYSGDLTIKSVDSPTKTALNFYVTSEEPLPLELLSITLQTKVTGYK